MLDVLFQGATFDQIRGYGGALGQGIAQALGVRLARPDRLVVSLVGDGAFNYSPIAAYFGMAQQYHVPILVIVCNNGGYQSQKWLTQAYFPDGAAVRGNNIMGSVIEPDIDYSALAAPFGGFGRRVTQISELEDAIRCALDAIRNGRFAVLDVRVTP
jgi:acetolactate synthase-1/2/3 large subunit